VFAQLNKYTHQSLIGREIRNVLVKRVGVFVGIFNRAKRDIRSMIDLGQFYQLAFYPFL
jgi:hypothetical protein